MSLFQPLPPSTPPADLNLTFLSFISSVTISAMVLTLALSGKRALSRREPDLTFEEPYWGTSCPEAEFGCHVLGL
jgi:hypothetical protein